MFKSILHVLLVGLIAGSALADTIELENGDKIDVTIVEETDDTLVVEHPQLGRMTVPRSALKPPAPPEPGLFGTRFMRGWSRSVGFGFGGASGSSENASVNASLQFGRDAKSYRSKFQSSYFYASQDGVRNTNAFRAVYDHDFLFGESRFFLFGQGQYQYDQFQEWLHRISANAGGGYEIIKRDNADLMFKLGAGVARTEGNQNQWKPEGVVGLVGSWKPFDGHTFTADVTYYPDFDDLPTFRLQANAAYQIAVSPIDGLSLKFGVNEEYDDSIDTSQTVPGSNPPRNQQKNNLKYFGNLVYEF